MLMSPILYIESTLKKPDCSMLLIAHQPIGFKMKEYSKSSFINYYYYYYD